VKSGERSGRLDFAKLIEQADSVRPNTNRTRQESNPKWENPKDHNEASTELRKQVAAAEPLLFQLKGVVLSLGFEREGEATAFADAFDGQVLSETDARSALQHFAAGGSSAEAPQRGWMPR
jgi:hypothetical protein